LLRLEENRYALYALVRERARQDLAEDDPCRDRLVRWLARLGDPERLTSRADDPALLATLHRVLPDLRATFARTRDPSVGLAAVWYLYRQTAVDEGLALGTAVLAVAEAPRVRVLLALSMASLQVARGELAEARALLEPEVEEAEVPYDIVAARSFLSILRHSMGDHDGVRAELERARPHLPLAGQAQMYWLQAMGGHQYSDESEQLVRESARVARKYGDRGGEIYSLLLLVGKMDRREGWEELDVVVERVVGLCAHDGLPLTTRVSALCIVGSWLRIKGALDEAEPMLEEARELARRAGLPDRVQDAQIQLARLWMQQGRIEDAWLEVEPLTQRTAPDLMASYAMALWGELWMHKGEPERAEAALRQALGFARHRRLESIEGAILDTLAAATCDPSLFEQGAALSMGWGRRVRREALRCLVAARRGELPLAQATRDHVRREMERLRWGPASESGFWLDKALGE
jgi:tetratricopeptide (TPR) repeat protein